MCETPDLAACIVATVVICAVAFAVGLWIYVHSPHGEDRSKDAEDLAREQVAKERNDHKRALRYEGRDLPR